MKDKYLILLPDGIGLRNFAYTKFYSLLKNSDKVDVVLWNFTPFGLKEMGFNELKSPQPKLHKLTEVYKNSRKDIELYLNVKKTKDQVYYSYKFTRSYNTLKSIIKNTWTTIVSSLNKTKSGLKRVQKKILSLEKSTSYYAKCLEILREEKPSVVFCTNQRPSIAIAPIEAAKSLNIPTVCFIFSWDNLPKATIVVESDYYFVWSKHMKKELLFYYPDIKKEQVIVTGTPQFEVHFNKDLLLSKIEFYEKYNLDIEKKYICFSGDDITTSPNDPYYLRDTAEAISKLNNEGYNIGIIFRRCPVDFSDRYDTVLEKYSDIIIPIAPKWQKAGSMWNAIMPTIDDSKLLTNTAKHTELVINVGSSMVFDYVCHNKPCAFINYDSDIKNHPTWNIEHIYKYIHFKSMPNDKSVLWLNSKDAIKDVIKNVIDKQDINTVNHANDWFNIIVDNPKTASECIISKLKEIAKSK